MVCPPAGLYVFTLGDKLRHSQTELISGRFIPSKAAGNKALRSMPMPVSGDGDEDIVMVLQDVFQLCHVESYNGLTASLAFV